MENITKTYDDDNDGCLHSLRRMGFESARLDDSTSRIDIRDYWSDDRLIRNLDGRRKKGRQMIKNVVQYVNRIWCALLNRKCCETCDCEVKKDASEGE